MDYFPRYYINKALFCVKIIKNSIENLFDPLELIFNKIYYSLRLYKLMHEKSGF